MPAPILKSLGIAIAIALLVAGCGSSDNQSSLTKQQFIKQGDAICARADKIQLAAIGAAVKKDPQATKDKAAEEKVIVTVGLPPIQREAEELAELGTPSGDEGEAEAIVQGIEKAVEEAKKNPGSVMQSTNTPFDEVDKLSAKYGFKVCSEAA